MTEGALRLPELTAKDATIGWKKVTCYSGDMILNEENLSDIHSTGRSRIPVWQGNPHNIIGLCLVKDLVLVNPLQGDKLSYHSRREPLVASKDINLFDLLNLFQKERSHLALVVDNEQEKNRVKSCFESKEIIPDEIKFLGIITLEDVIEKIIQERIHDETDPISMMNIKINIARSKSASTSRSISANPDNWMHNYNYNYNYNHDYDRDNTNIGTKESVRTAASYKGRGKLGANTDGGLIVSGVAKDGKLNVNSDIIASQTLTVDMAGVDVSITATAGHIHGHAGHDHVDAYNDDINNIGNRSGETSPLLGTKASKKTKSKPAVNDYGGILDSDRMHLATLTKEKQRFHDNVTGIQTLLTLDESNSQAESESDSKS